MIEIETKEDLQYLNTTELVLHARWMGIPGASRGAPRSALIDAIWDNTSLLDNDGIKKMRFQMRRWLRRFWNKKFKMQAPKDECPECNKCSDLQIMDCYHKNKDQII